MTSARLLLSLVAALHASAATLDEYLTAQAMRHLQERGARVAALRTPQEIRQRQEEIRTKVLAALGGFPAAKTNLNPRITGTLERGDYRVEKLLFESLPGFHVTANVYVPKNAKPPYPAVLGVAGHSSNGKASSTYQRGWIGMAKRGMLVLAYDPPGQGERSEYLDPSVGRSRPGIGVPEHIMAGLQCLLTGGNIARYELWDGVRAVDYLLTRADVDPRRIAVAGNSGGGTQAAYLAVVEPRLAAAAPSCYITSWETLWSRPGPQDSEQVFADFLADGLNFGDFLIAFAPKPLKVLAAIRDFFPIDGARDTFAEARQVYGKLGAEDRISFFEYDDPHGWSRPRREATFQWFEQWLNNRATDGHEPEFDTELDVELEVTPTGQVATSSGGETVQSLNAKVASSIYPKRSASAVTDAETLRTLVAKRLSLNTNRGQPAVLRESPKTSALFRETELVFGTEEQMEFPARVLAPLTAEGSMPAILYLDPLAYGQTGDAAVLARLGHIVLIPRLRAWQFYAPQTRGYSPAYQTAMRAILVGRSLLGFQVHDALRSLDYLKSRPDVDGTRIALFAKGNGGPVALHTALFEPGIRKVAIEGALPSFMAIAQAKQHEGVIDLIVPGILKDYDLRDVARLMAAREFWFVEPRTPTGTRAPIPEAQADFPRAKVRYRPESWPFERVYGKWLRVL
ncbi:MAG: acetylxylan esterase [Bryobacteraceae bacterium]